MPEYEPVMENIPRDSLYSELKRILHRLFVYEGQESDFDLRNYSAVLLDFKHAIENGNHFIINKLINAAMTFGKPLILLSVHDGRQLSKMLGMGFDSRCMIIRPFSDYNVFHVLGVSKEDMYDCGNANVIQNEDGSRYFSIQDPDCGEQMIHGCQVDFNSLSAARQARIIENILASDFKVPQETVSQPFGDTPVDLPTSQFKLNYLAIESIWNLSDLQITNNAVVMEISLIASYNPRYKYLRIRSVGAGFNPANGAEIQWNGSYDRGFFQSNVNIHMQPNTDKLRTLSTEPKNINNQTTYTTSSQFSVGVDVSKNPSFNSSYTISESTSTVVSDFNVYNNGAGVTADWDFKLSMTEDSIWDIFSEKFMEKAKVRELPALATKNLQAVTEAVWYADSSLNETVGVQLYWKVDHYHCYVTGDWMAYTEHYYHKWSTVGYKDTPFYIDFSSVNA
jgi:hypothetical protein